MEIKCLINNVEHETMITPGSWDFAAPCAFFYIEPLFDFTYPF